MLLNKLPRILKKKNRKTEEILEAREETEVE